MQCSHVEEFTPERGATYCTAEVGPGRMLCDPHFLALKMVALFGEDGLTLG